MVEEWEKILIFTCLVLLFNKLVIIVNLRDVKIKAKISQVAITDHCGKRLAYSRLILLKKLSSYYIFL